MVLFEFDKILKSKYSNYKINCPEKVSSIQYGTFYQIGIEKIFQIFPFYFSGINLNYVKNAISDEKNKILLFGLGEKFDIKNIVSIIIYRKIKSPICNKYLVLAFGTNERYRNLGYGKNTLDEFIQWIKLNNSLKTVKTCKIILKSLESSFGFYLEYGFVQTDLKSNKIFYKYENARDLSNESEKILEYIIVK
jgi:hypothetical protein